MWRKEESCMLLLVKVWGAEPSCGRSSCKANLIKSWAVLLCASLVRAVLEALWEIHVYLSVRGWEEGVSPGGSAQEGPGSSSSTPSVVLAGVPVSVPQSCLAFLQFLLSQALVSRLSPDKQSESDVTKCFPSDALRDLCSCGCTGVSRSMACLIGEAREPRGLGEKLPSQKSILYKI